MTYEEAGVASMLPGLIHAHEVLGQRIQEMQALLAQLQTGIALEPRALLGPAAREFQRKSKATKGYWAQMSPEERSAEMRRRGAIRKDRRNGDHYGKVSAGAKGYWAKMSKEERQAEMARRVEVRNQKWAEAENTGKLHPRDPKSPRHAAWVKKMRQVSKASWAKRRNAVPAVKMQHLNGEATQ